MVIPLISPSAGRRNANPVATEGEGAGVPFCTLSRYWELCILHPLALSLLSAVPFLFFDNHCAKSVIKLRQPCVTLMFNLAWSLPPIPPPAQEGGKLGGVKGPPPTSLLLSLEVGRPAGGACRPGLASPGQLERAPPASPLPLLGRVPVKLWPITRSLSQLLPVFALSVPPPLAS